MNYLNNIKDKSLIVITLFIFTGLMCLYLYGKFQLSQYVEYIGIALVFLSTGSLFNYYVQICRNKDMEARIAFDKKYDDTLKNLKKHYDYLYQYRTDGYQYRTDGATKLQKNRDKLIYKSNI